MGRVTASRIAKIALDAANQATIDSDEHNLSVCELGQLNEQWIHSYVGYAISRHLQVEYGGDDRLPFVTYETSVSWLEYFFDQKRSSGPIRGRLSDRRRFDITVWSRDRKAMGLIEIKYQPIMSTYSRTTDPEKLLGALRRWDSLRWGMFLYCTRNNSGRDGEELLKHLKESSKRTFHVIEKALSGRARLSYRASDVDEAQALWAAVLIRRPD